MKYVRFAVNGQNFYGIYENDRITKIRGSYFENYTLTDETFASHEVKLLAPAEPSKILLVGLNYRVHANELGMELPEEPKLFMKPSTTVIGPDATIIYPPVMTNHVDYEAEIGAVIGRRCRNITPEEAADYIFGYTCVNDITARDLQRKDGQWTRSKSFDTFNPFGPWIVKDIDPMNCQIALRQNGEIKQSSNTRYMIFSVYEIVSYVSQIMTLLPGDLIATGTPPGVGPVQRGDVLEVMIEGIGTLRNDVK